MVGILQLFRKLDGLASEIESLQPPVNLWRKFIYCTSLSGPILGSVDHMRAQGVSVLLYFIYLRIYLIWIINHFAFSPINFHLHTTNHLMQILIRS